MYRHDLTSPCEFASSKYCCFFTLCKVCNLLQCNGKMQMLQMFCRYVLVQYFSFTRYADLQLSDLIRQIFLIFILNRTTCLCGPYQPILSLYDLPLQHSVIWLQGTRTDINRLWHNIAHPILSLFQHSVCLQKQIHTTVCTRENFKIRLLFQNHHKQSFPAQYKKCDTQLNTRILPVLYQSNDLRICLPNNTFSVDFYNSVTCKGKNYTLNQLDFFFPCFHFALLYLTTSNINTLNSRLVLFKNEKRRKWKMRNKIICKHIQVVKFLHFSQDIFR